MRPPDVKENWDDNDVWTQALLISYHQIRELEDAKLMEAMAQAGIARMF